MSSPGLWAPIVVDPINLISRLQPHASCASFERQPAGEEKRDQQDLGNPDPDQGRPGQQGLAAGHGHDVAGLVALVAGLVALFSNRRPAPPAFGFARTSRRAPSGAPRSPSFPRRQGCTRLATNGWRAPTSISNIPV